MPASNEPWGKLEHDASGRVVAEQALRRHCRDVAAVFDGLCRLPGIGGRLARLAGRGALDEVTLARFGWLVHLHDCGKVNAGFQARRDVRRPPVGHIKPLAVLFGDKADRALAGEALAALGAERLASWGAGVDALFDAVLSHHGRPWPRDEPSRFDVVHWRPSENYDPMAELRRLRDDADAMFPAAFADHAPSLPTPAPFVHAIAGLAQLADWIASSEWRDRLQDRDRAAWSAALLRRIGLDPGLLRGRLRAGEHVRLEAAFGFPPRPAQALAASVPGALCILEAETGSGKTEAALWRFVELFRAGAVDGLFFALPTRTAAAQLHRRVEAMVARPWPAKAPPVVLAVPGYLDDAEPGGLPLADDPLDAAAGEGTAPTVPVWASEHPKRYFVATISVGTVDQALLAGLRVKHAHLRGAALLRHLVVVDEVHGSDRYMRGILERLLEHHLSAGGHALLLSATLGAETRLRLAGCGRSGDGAVTEIDLAEAIATPYPLLTTVSAENVGEVEIAADGRSKAVAVETRNLLDDPATVAAETLAAARAGAKVLVVRNTVAGALAVQSALEEIAGPDAPELFRVAGVATLHHGRFAREDRRLLDAAVEAALGKARPSGGCVVVGTQTLEMSLDIDADVLITDLCPVDVLLQRLGRLHRHACEPDGRPRRRAAGFDEPRAIVLTPAGGLAPFLAARRPGRLPQHGLGFSMRDGTVVGVYADIAVLEATRRLVVAEPLWRIPEMNRELVERGLHSQAIDALIDGLPDADRSAWRDHRTTVEGRDFAFGAAAAASVLRRDLGFMDPANRLDADERIRTRLGEDSLMIDLPEGTTGPFGRPIRRLSLPGWMATMLLRAPSTLTVQSPWSEWSTHLSYDRWGLRLSR